MSKSNFYLYKTNLIHADRETSFRPFEPDRLP